MSNRIGDGLGLPTGPINPEDDGIDRGLLNTIEMTGPVFKSGSRTQRFAESDLDSYSFSKGGIESDKEIRNAAKRALRL